MDTVTVPRSEPTRAKHAEGMVAYQQKGMRLCAHTFARCATAVRLQLMGWPGLRSCKGVDGSQIYRCGTFHGARFSGKHQSLSKIHAIDC